MKKVNFFRFKSKEFESISQKMESLNGISMLEKKDILDVLRTANVPPPLIICFILIGISICLNVYILGSVIPVKEVNLLVKIFGSSFSLVFTCFSSFITVYRLNFIVRYKELYFLYKKELPVSINNDAKIYYDILSNENVEEITKHLNNDLVKLRIPIDLSRELSDQVKKLLINWTFEVDDD
ncbi:MAG: hypothetical protein WCO35_03425 [Candidatus Nomurabacteria bacterium]